MLGAREAVAVEVENDATKLTGPAKLVKLDNVRVVDPEEP
jgi:hypothetical protein